MSDITKRQAYVFLQDGDVIQKHDEFFNGTEWLTTDIDGKLFGYDTCSTVQYRRPIATPEQSDKLTVWDLYFAGAMAGHASMSTSREERIIQATRDADAMMKARAGK